MGISERKERDRENKRQTILETAQIILLEEGLQALSIRKIAARMEYSPPLIYHYFKDKEDIVAQVMSLGYQKLINSLKSSFTEEGDPQSNLLNGLKAYIQSAWNNPESYKYFMLSESPSILAYTSVLAEGSVQQREALGLLSEKLKLLLGDRPIKARKLELMAQAIWTAVFGLTLRLIIEARSISSGQMNALVDQQLEILLSGVIHSK